MAKNKAKDMEIIRGFWQINQPVVWKNGINAYTYRPENNKNYSVIENPISIKIENNTHSKDAYFYNYSTEVKRALDLLEKFINRGI